MQSNQVALSGMQMKDTISEIFLKKQTEEAMAMFARFTTVQFKIDKLDTAVQICEKSIVPTAQAQKGFVKLNMFTLRTYKTCSFH